MAVFRLALRAVIGGLFVGHGTQKLFGWFGGPGREGTQGMMRSIGMRPSRHHALAAGASEAGGGALLALGLATPLAASTLIGTMATAIRNVHWKNGVWVTGGGYEYNLVLIAALAALAESGPGPLSLDAVLGLERTGWRWGLGALALGVGTSTAVVELAGRQPEEDAPGPVLSEGAGDRSAAEDTIPQTPEAEDATEDAAARS